MEQKETTGVPMIDFARLQELIPNNGSLTLVFKRAGEKIAFCYLPKYNVKDSEKEKFTPFTHTALPNELNELSKDGGIKQIAEKEKSLEEAITAKLAEIQKKIDDAKKKPATTSAQKGKTVQKPSDDKQSTDTPKEEKKDDLFSFGSEATEKKDEKGAESCQVNAAA